MTWPDGKMNQGQGNGRFAFSLSNPEVSAAVDESLGTGDAPELAFPVSLAYEPEAVLDVV